MLRPDTEVLWNLLRHQPSLGGLILVGGTALSMHLNHRLSEDLDFMYPQTSLPRAKLAALKKSCAAHHVEFVENDDPGALAEFEDSGLDYHDFQQDYIVGGTVKVTFVAPEPEVQRLLMSGSDDGPRVASVEEIFRLKCIACANRSKTRDWLDMYVMLSTGMFKPYDMYKAFEIAGVVQKCQIALNRMCSGRVDLLDEGYESLLTKPPSIEDMAEYFKSVRNEVEIKRSEIESQKSMMATLRPKC